MRPDCTVRYRLVTKFVGLSLGVFLGIACGAPSAATANDLPVQEVTVFKDGHTMVYRQGTMPVNASGRVVLDDLPQPVLGTFWAFENEPGATLSAVRAGVVETSSTRTPQNMADLLRLSIGQRIAWNIRSNTESTGTLIALLPDETNPSIALIEHDRGGREAIPMGSLQFVRFLSTLDPEAEITTPTHENQLSLEFAWQDPGAIAEQAEVGVMYLQKGMRWIPSYRVTLLDDAKSARIELQASLINDLIELDDATVHLVVGVPRFEFEHTPDPIALSEQFAQLGTYFQRQSGTAGAFSNALMAQSARMQEARGPQDFQSGTPGTAPSTPPELSASDHNEDMYVFSIDHVSLGVGERMILPISTSVVPMEAIYKLRLPGSPPVQAWRQFSTDQQRRIAELLDRPVARHVLRLTNESDHPFTTAPALIIHDGKPLAQGLMTYTAKGSTTDLEVTDAVDIRVKIDEHESGRETRGMIWDGNQYARIDLEAAIELTNFKPHRATLEITKYAFGLPTSASNQGKATALGMFQDASLWGNDQRVWWYNYGWPWWWHRLNGVTRFNWTITLEPGESIDLSAQWHYFWR